MKCASHWCMFEFAKKQTYSKETHMTINNTLETLRSSKELPFKDILSDESIGKQLEGIGCRERIFTPEVVIFGFLAQAISADQSCQMGLAQIISWLASQGKKLPSANTAAYCKARAKLPEAVLSCLAK